MGERVAWEDMPAWESGEQGGAWPALLRNCRALGDEAPWRAICNEAELYPTPTAEQVRRFIRGRFTPYRMRNGAPSHEGLITGYYEPLLHGSRERTPRYRYPLYEPPPDLVPVRLGPRFPKLSGERVRGRLTEDKRVVPYYTRAEIEGPQEPLAGHELLWVDDPVDRFLLHIQGSGRIRLPDGEVLSVGYADQNGHRYVSIGRVLAEQGEMAREEVSLPRLRDWLSEHPHRRRELFNENPSYVFFRIRRSGSPFPEGTLGVPLTPRRSLAVDPRHIPLGYPVWLDTVLPSPGRDGESPVFRRLVLAQDTGGAIRGPVRGDLFTGQGWPAEWLAGRMKQPGRLFVLMPAWRYGVGDSEGDEPAE